MSTPFLLRAHSRPVHLATLLHIIEPVKEEALHAFVDAVCGCCMMVCCDPMTAAIHPTIHIRQDPEPKALQSEMLHILHAIEPSVHKPLIKHRRFPPISHHHHQLRQQPIKTRQPIRRLRRRRKPVRVHHRLPFIPRESLHVAATSRDRFAEAPADGTSAFPAMLWMKPRLHSYFSTGSVEGREKSGRMIASREESICGGKWERREKRREGRKTAGSTTR